MNNDYKKLDQALRNVSDKIEVANALRENVLIKSVLDTVRSGKRYTFDAEDLSNEVGAIGMQTDFDAALELGSTEEEEKANRIRFELRSARSRLIAMNRGLRRLLLHLNRAHRICATHIKSDGMLAEVKATAKVADDIVTIALREITDKVEEVELLLTEVREAIGDLDDKNGTIDAWFFMHKQHVFLTLNRRPAGDEENQERQYRGARRR